MKLNYPLICFMGPSASGKTFVSEKFFGKSKKIITTTTRKKRPKEKNKVDYYFISHTSFQALMEKKAFLETDEYAGEFYGTRKIEVLKKTKHQVAFAVVTVPGYYALKKQLQPVIPVYLTIDEQTLITRLKRRRLSQEEMAKRIALFTKEQEQLQLLQKTEKNLILLDNTKSPKETFLSLHKKLQPYLK